MTFSNSILYNLQEKFFIGFELCDFKSEDEFSIVFANQETNKFIMDVLIKSDSRLKITLRTGNFAGDVIQLLHDASRERKTLFLKYLNEINAKLYSKLKVFISGEEANDDSILNESKHWDSFKIEFQSFPFYDPDDNNRLDVVSSNVIDIWSLLLSLLPYTIEGKSEGTEYEKIVTKHERNPINRQLCVALKGYSCAVCGMNFEKVYGDIGRKFIEVHHTNPVSEMGDNHIVDVINELVPLCSNCHSMIHRRKPPYSVEELKMIIEASKKQS